MPDYTKDLRPLTPNEQAIHDAIGYDPVRVSMPGGIGGLTHRTADDMDNLIAKLAPLLNKAKAEALESLADELEADGYILITQNGVTSMPLDSHKGAAKVARYRAKEYRYV